MNVPPTGPADETPAEEPAGPRYLGTLADSEAGEHDVSGFLPPRPSVVAVWPCPSWASSSRLDGEMVWHSRTIGEVAALPTELGNADPRRIVVVEVCQADDVEIDGDQVRSRRGPITIYAAGEDLLPVDARLLGRLLIEAADLADEVGR